jgi:hypothetical protein
MWQLSATEAAFDSLFLTGSIDPAAPLGGIRRLTWRGHSLPDWSLFELAAPVRRWNDPLRIEDQYIRGDDFVVEYQQVVGPNVQPQFYWRLHAEPQAAAAGMEILVSLRTSLLASRPESALRSSIGEEAELLVCDANADAFHPLSGAVMSGKTFQAEVPIGGLLARPKARDFSYVEFGDPSDCAELEFEPLAISKGWRWEYTLFREHLEKGVIRRGRLQGWFLPRENDEELARQLRAAFLRSPPPLTT